MGQVVYRTHIHYARNVVMYTYRQYDICITFFTRAAVMLKPSSQSVAMCVPHHQQPEVLSETPRCSGRL
jgi:hypothetical protein